MRIPVMAILVLTLPAMALAPFEHRLHAERNRLKYGSAKAALTLRDRISQNTWIALLAGFRGVVADFIWIQGHQYWETKQWLRQYRALDTVVMLQPQSVLFWDMGSWHLGWNIAYAERISPDNVTQAQGIQRERIWHERAEAFLKRGIENIPNRYELYFKLGWLYHMKFHDHCRAEKYFGKAASFPSAPPFIGRMYARAKEGCGEVKEAYEYWRDLWFQGPANIDMPSIVARELKRLEDLLDLPEDERVFPKHTDTDANPTP